MEDKLNLIKVNSVLNKSDSVTTTIPIFKDVPLSYYKEKYTDNRFIWVTSVNGRVIPEDKLYTYIPQINDYIVFMPKLEDGDILRSLAFIALVLIAVVVPPMWGAAFALNTIGGALATMAIMTVGGLLINALLPASVPKIDGMDTSDYDKSQTYSWSPQTVQSQGIVIPSAYGLNKVYGNIINAYIENIDDKQYMNLLLCLGFNVWNRLYDIKIGDQSLDNYSDVEIYTRLGNIDQQIIPNFNDSKQEHVFNNIKLNYNSPYTHTTNGDSFDGLEVELSCPSLYAMDDYGNQGSASISYNIEIKKHDEAVWESITHTYSIGGISGYGAYYPLAHYGWFVGFYASMPYVGNTFIALLEPNITQQELNRRGIVDGTSFIEIPELNIYKPSGYESQTLWWRYCKNVVPDYAVLNYETVTKAVNSEFYITKKVNIVPSRKGQYDIRVIRTNPDSSSLRVQDDLYLSSVREVYQDDFTYPRHVLVGIRALATDNLSGQFKFSCLAEGKLISCYDDILGGNTTWTVRYSNNPAWVAYDVITQPVYETTPTLVGYKWFTTNYSYDINGQTTITVADIPISSIVGSNKYIQDYNGDDILWTGGAQTVTVYNREIVRYEGRNPSNLDLTSFINLADYCDQVVPDGKGGWEKRVTFNGVFDTEQNVWEAALKVLEIAHSTLVWNGVQLQVITDKKVSTPVQLFTVGNIGEDSFKETFLQLEDRISELEIEYSNNEKDFDRDKLRVINNNIDTSSNVTTLQAFGLIKPSEVWRYGSYKLNNNQYILRTIEWEAELDSIRAQVGDVVYLQHDVPQWGYGGRIVSAENSLTTSSITLDRSVVIDGLTTYTIAVRIGEDDSLVSKTVTNLASTTSVIYANSTFTVLPAKYDIYAVGHYDTLVKPVRIVNIERQNDLVANITAVDYNENIYASDYLGLVTPTLNYSALSPFPTLNGLTLNEFCYIDDGATLRRGTNVAFTVGNNAMYKEAEVYYKVANSNDAYTLDGKTSTNHYKLPLTLYNTEYLVGVLGVNVLGNKDNMSALITSSIRCTIPPQYASTFENYRLSGLRVFDSE